MGRALPAPEHQDQVGEKCVRMESTAQDCQRNPSFLDRRRATTEPAIGPRFART
jgi:hypothetical protein